MPDLEPLTALMEGLSAAQNARLTASVTEITSEAVKRYGIAPSLSEVAALAQVKVMTLEGVEGDLENALYQLKTEAPSVVAHLAAASESGVEAVTLGQGFAETGIISAEDMSSLPPAYAGFVRAGMTGAQISEEVTNSEMRANIGRALMVPVELRQASSLTSDGQAYTDNLPDEFLTPAALMERHRSTLEKA